MRVSKPGAFALKSRSAVASLPGRVWSVKLYPRVTHAYTCTYICVCVHDVCCELLFARLEKNNSSKFSQRVEFVVFVVVSLKLFSAVVCVVFVCSRLFFVFSYSQELYARVAARRSLRRRVVVISHAVDVVNDDAGGDTYRVQSPKLSDVVVVHFMTNSIKLLKERERKRGDRAWMHCLTCKAILAVGSFDLQAM